MAVAVTNTALTAWDTEAAVTENAATSSVIDATEDFTITPTRAAKRILIRSDEISGAQGAVALSVAVGAQFNPAAAALAMSVAQGTAEVVIITTAKFLSAAGTIVITATPASGKRLLTDHAFQMSVVELPF